MTRKQILLSLVTVFLVTVIFFVVFVFMQALQPAAPIRNNESIIDLSLLKPGEVKRFHINGMPVTVVYPDKVMLDDLEYLNSHVWNPQRSGELNIDNKTYYIFYSVGTAVSGRGCSLTHRSKKEPNEYLPSHKWLGGFYDPCRDFNYDYSGRSIRTMKHTWINLNTETPNLKQPHVVYKGDGKLRVNIYGR